MKRSEQQERGKAEGGGTRLSSEGPAEEVTRRPEPGCTYPYFLDITHNSNLNTAIAAGSSGSSTRQPRAALAPPCYFFIRPGMRRDAPLWGPAPGVAAGFAAASQRLRVTPGSAAGASPFPASRQKPVATKPARQGAPPILAVRSSGCVTVHF